MTLSSGPLSGLVMAAGHCYTLPQQCYSSFTTLLAGHGVLNVVGNDGERMREEGGMCVLRESVYMHSYRHECRSTCETQRKRD